MRAAHRARVRLAERVLAPGGGVEDALPGELVSLSTVETTRIGEGVGAVILGVGAVAGSWSAPGSCWPRRCRIGLAVIVGVPVVLLAVQALSAPLVARADAHQEAVGTAAGVAADLLRRAAGAQGARRRPGGGGRLPPGQRHRARAGRSTPTGCARPTPASPSPSPAGSWSLVAWIGGHQALDGQITIGELVAALGLTQFLLGPARPAGADDRGAGPGPGQLRPPGHRPRRLGRRSPALGSTSAAAGPPGTALADAAEADAAGATAEAPAAGALDVRGLAHGPSPALDLDDRAPASSSASSPPPGGRRRPRRLPRPDGRPRRRDGRRRRHRPPRLDLADARRAVRRRPPRRPAVRGLARRRGGQRGRRRAADRGDRRPGRRGRRRGRRRPGGGRARPRRGGPGRCRAGSASGSRWPGRWPPTPRCSCSTSRPPPSTPPPSTASPPGSRALRAGRTTRGRHHEPHAAGRRRPGRAGRRRPGRGRGRPRRAGGRDARYREAVLA